MQFVTFVKESVSTVNRTNATVDFDVVSNQKITINRNDKDLTLPMLESHEDIEGKKENLPNLICVIGKISIKSTSKTPIEYKSIFIKLKGKIGKLI
jgi:hypothetical protein